MRNKRAILIDSSNTVDVASVTAVINPFNSTPSLIFKAGGRSGVKRVKDNQTQEANVLDNVY